MKISDMRRDRLPRVLRAIQRGERPRDEDIGRAIEAAMRGGQPIPQEVLLYVVAILKGDLRRGRGRSRKKRWPLELAWERQNKQLDAVATIMSLEEARRELRWAGKPHNNPDVAVHLKSLWPHLPTENTILANYRRARSIVGPAEAARIAAEYRHPDF